MNARLFALISLALQDSNRLRISVVGWDNRSSSFWPRSSDHFDHFGKHQSGIYMPQGPEFIRCDYPNPLPEFLPACTSLSLTISGRWHGASTNRRRRLKA
ncbi:hypothetical protein C2W62_07960 [Candidatus Entotheonella serta]|nr:hypothetical protein C2W62_07960 [Candidatus Entotheonella serta]